MLKYLFVATMMMLSIVTTAQEMEQLQMPCFDGGADLKSLRSCSEVGFQANLDAVIFANPVWKKLVEQKRMSIGLVDIRDTAHVHYAELNGDEMMYAASLPKIAILLAAMDAMEKKELKETKAIKKDLRLMISKSNNQASTRMIDRLGYAKIEAVLTDPKYGLYDENCGGGIWVGKRYAAGGAKNPDPIKGLSHAATATQVCRFYYLMFQGKLVSEQRSQEMMTYLVNPALHHKFVNSLKLLAPRALFFRKSGSWKSYHSDSVMVWGPKRKYILTAMVDDPKGEQIMRELVYAVEKVMKKK